MEKSLFSINPQAIKAIVKEALEEFLFSRGNLSPETPPLPEVMGVKEAALFLNKKVPTLYGMTSRREIPHYKRGKRLYFRRAELEAWILEGKCRTQEEIAEDAIQQMKQKKGGRR